jgi:hypothetical protein
VGVERGGVSSHGTTFRMGHKMRWFTNEPQVADVDDAKVVFAWTARLMLCSDERVHCRISDTMASSAATVNNARSAQLYQHHRAELNDRRLFSHLTRINPLAPASKTSSPPLLHKRRCSNEKKTACRLKSR